MLANNGRAAQSSAEPPLAVALGDMGQCWGWLGSVSSQGFSSLNSCDPKTLWGWCCWFYCWVQSGSLQPKFLTVTSPEC